MRIRSAAAEHLEGFLDTLQMGVLFGYLMALAELLNGCITIDILCEVYLIGTREILDSSRDIHRLPEVIQLVVQVHSDGSSAVEPDLQSNIFCSLSPVESIDLIEHGIGSAHSIPGGLKRCHHRIPDGLHDRSLVLFDRFAQVFEMMLHQCECLKVTYPLIKLSRGLQVGEENSEIPDTQGLFMPDCLTPEEITEGL